jgi:hypothetical protein
MVSLRDVVEAFPLIKESESSEVVRVAPDLAAVCAYLDPLPSIVVPLLLARYDCCPWRISLSLELLAGTF